MKTRSPRLPILTVFALLGLTACETVDGIGQDVQSGGAALSETANEVQAEL